jgi:hypothetical protein
MLMMEAARTSETSVDNCFTRQYIPEDNSELQESDRRKTPIAGVAAGRRKSHHVGCLQTRGEVIAMCP